MVSNLCANEHRRSSSTEGPLGMDGCLDESVQGSAGVGIERALATLSAGEREVIALRILLDLEIETAARVLGISSTACTTRLSRALKKLEERMSADVAA